MSGPTRRPLALVGVLAVLSICGLVTMLLAGSTLGDTAGFALTALPLVVGVWQLRRARMPASR
ncbi:MAG TPA: hypothetical protein VGE51_02910 [Fontimonas sp.]